jgi:methylated-DNA-protein-cysteine methyltransferase-like protein
MKPKFVPLDLSKFSLSPFAKCVFELISEIPEGSVTTYKRIAELTAMKMQKNPCAQAVGQILKKNPNAPLIPCHRVVHGDGSLCPGYTFGGDGIQRGLLEDEGVMFLPGGKVDMEKCEW